MCNIFFLKRLLEFDCNAAFLQQLLQVRYHFYISLVVCALKKIHRHEKFENNFDELGAVLDMSVF